MIDTVSRDRCYGCFACLNVCPTECITMEPDDEGFFMPHINHEACLRCGKCDDVCIIGKKSETLCPGRNPQPTCYIGYITNPEQRVRSASGGLSYALSRRTFAHGGVAFGVVGKWFEDVHHIMATTAEDLDAVSMSKNIQSRVGQAYAEAKAQLEAGREVLFTGTPCQIAALYSYLGKDYDTLLTADLICHGVPSQKVLRAYISTLEEKKGQKVVKFGRDNTYQYQPVQYIAWYSDRSHEVLMPQESLYRKGFLSNLFQRRSCMHCEYSRLPRVGDITMGDAFFLTAQERAELDPDNQGISILTTNTEKGSHALREIKADFVTAEMPLQRAMENCPWLTHGIGINKGRETFYHRFLSDGFEAAAGIMEESYQRVEKRAARRNRLALLTQPKLLWRKLLRKVKRH